LRRWHAVLEHLTFTRQLLVESLVLGLMALLKFSRRQTARRLLQFKLMRAFEGVVLRSLRGLDTFAFGFVAAQILP
jgi:hypothetical protein